MKNKKISKIVILLIILCLVGASIAFGVDVYVKSSTKDNIIEVDDTIEKYESILILGAGLVGNRPSPMLKERLDKGIDLYKGGVSDKIIMSGDHVNTSHDEVNVMKEYAIENGVKSEDIFMDHAGVSTYDSIYRAKEIFGLSDIIVVTQKYHLYRALYIAKKLEIDAVGVDAKKKTYNGQLKRDIREILARNKDFVKCIFKPVSTYTGDIIAVSESGNVTNDKPYISISNDTEEFYITKEENIKRIEEIIKTSTFKKKTIKYSLLYKLELEDKQYDLVSHKNTIYIVDDKYEAKLNKNDTKFILGLLK